MRQEPHEAATKRHKSTNWKKGVQQVSPIPAVCFSFVFCGFLRLVLWLGFEALDDLVAEGAGVAFDRGFVERQQTSIAHDDAAVD